MTTATSFHTPLFYDEFGDATNPAVVLLPGLGSQGISWSHSFCSKLSKAGLYILRMDNRDSGQSPIFNKYPVPDLQLMQQGASVAIPYRLEDMAKDVAVTLAHAHIDKAHIIGRSMGGMIAQIFAAIFAEKTRSLCVIMATTGNRALSPPQTDVLAMLLAPKPDPLSNYADYIESSLAFLQRLCGNGANFDEQYYRQYVQASFERQYSPAGTLRQIAAMVATGDIRKHLKNIVAPTLVLHGVNDPMFGVDAAQDIQQNISGAELQLIEGMGHEIPPSLEGAMIELIQSHLLRSIE